MKKGCDLEREASALAVRAFHIGLWSATLPDGPVVWDERMSELTGHPAPKDPRAWVMQYVHVEDRQALRDATERLGEGDFELAAVRVLSPRGRVSWIRLNGRVYVDAHGHPHRVVGSAMDVSEAILAQQRLARSARFETLGQFSAGVSHNFNNMLMVISSCLDELSTTLDGGDGRPERSARAMNDAQDATRRAAQVVAQLANLARPEKADERTRVRVSDICREMGRLVARVFPEQIRFRESLDASAHVECAPGAIEQVLSNVLINARDVLLEARTPEPVVSLSVSVVDPDGDPTVRIVVRDNGPGIPEAVLDRIFEPFVTTKGSGGTGLGLASAAAIMERHGGQIMCRNLPEGGAEFLIQLPVVEGPTQATTSTGSPAKSALELAGARVLVVDDEAAIVRVVSKSLSRAGFAVTGASSVEGARALLEGADDFSLVLLDRSLGVVKSDTLVPVIRQRMPRCKVLSFSGEPLDPPELAKVDGVVEKPVTMHHVVQAVREALGG